MLINLVFYVNQYFIAINAKISRIVVIEFSIELTIGSALTSSAPSVPAGRGPSIKKATAKEMIAERIKIILNQNLSFDIAYLSYIRED